MVAQPPVLVTVRRLRRSAVAMPRESRSPLVSPIDLNWTGTAIYTAPFRPGPLSVWRGAPGRSRRRSVPLTSGSGQRHGSAAACLRLPSWPRRTHPPRACAPAGPPGNPHVGWFFRHCRVSLLPYPRSRFQVATSLDELPGIVPPVGAHRDSSGAGHRPLRRHPFPKSRPPV